MKAIFIRVVVVVITCLCAIAHAGTWECIKLNPDDSVASAYGVSVIQQAGWVDYGTGKHATLWIGTADSLVDLHPANATESEARGVFGNSQVGYARISG